MSTQEQIKLSAAEGSAEGSVEEEEAPIIPEDDPNHPPDQEGDEEEEEGDQGTDTKHEVLLSLQCSLFRFDKGSNQWVTRGKGQLKLLRSLRTGLIRILLRDTKTYLLRLNHYILADMALHPNPGSDRSWTWTSRDYTDPKDPKLYTFAARFQDKDQAQEFKLIYDLARQEQREAVRHFLARKKKGSSEAQLPDVEIGASGESLAKKFQSLRVGHLPRVKVTDTTFQFLHPAVFGSSSQEQDQNHLDYDPEILHPAVVVPPVDERRRLWGGAFTCSLDPRFVDVSRFRTIPDYQEVFSDADSDQSVVFELLQLHPRPADIPPDQGENWLVHTCFQDLGKANHAFELNVERTEVKPLREVMPKFAASLESELQRLKQSEEDTPNLSDPEAASLSLPRAQFLYGNQVVGKYRDDVIAKGNTVHMVLVVIRLQHVQTDLLISFNFPVRIAEASSAGQLATATPEQIEEVVTEVLQSFQAVRWDIFASSEAEQ